MTILEREEKHSGTKSVTNWPKVVLDNLVDRLTNGYVGPTRDLYQEEGVPYLLARHVKANHLFFDGKTYVTQEFNAKHKKSILKTGDVLLVQSGHIGESAVVPPEHEGHNCHAMIVITPKHDLLDGKYLSRFFSSYIGKAEFQRIQTGITLKHLNCRDVKKIEIPLPPIEEQRRIAAILDKADAVRRKRKEAIALTEELLRSVFLDMFGDPVTNPKEWENRKLADFAEIQSGIAKGKKNDASQAVSVPYMRVANVQDGYVDLSEIKELQVRQIDAEKYALKKSDVLLTEGGDPDKLGRGAVWYGQIEPCIHQNHVFCVRPDYSVAEPEYLSAIIGSEYGKRYFLRAAKQTTGIATINKTQLKNFPALLPPIALQGKYVQTLEQIRRLRQRTEAKVNESDKLFNSLLQRAFRGEL